MTALRSEAGPSPFWPNYAHAMNVPHRIGSHVEHSLPNEPRNDGSIGEASQEQYDRYRHNEHEAYDAHPQHTPPSHSVLATQASYSSLKRSFSQTEAPAYQEMVQDLRDDGSRAQPNQDRSLLTFRKTPDKCPVTDHHGRVQTLDLSAQIHGMFFLSEMPTSSGDGPNQPPELTCYRRNLFQISGQLVAPSCPLYAVADAGPPVAIETLEVTVSAIESVDNNPVRLIVIPWKTPPPNSNEGPQIPDQEPASLPLIPFPHDESSSDGEVAVYPLGWRRLQFRVATANNGRRKELQQHFILHLKVQGGLANGTTVVLAESTTAPIVVRGRSPRNFQARKEIPLLGSSAGSRGQALVESGMGVVQGAGVLKQQDSKLRGVDVQVPRSPFSFPPQKAPGGPLDSVRPSAYPTWTPTGPVTHVASPTTTHYPSATVGPDAYGKNPTAASNFSTEPQGLAMPPSMAPLSLNLTSGENQHPQQPRTQYAYSQPTPSPRQVPGQSTMNGTDPSLGMARYGDPAHPAKSPRTANHPSIHSISSMTNSDAPSDYRYGGYSAINGSTDANTPNYGSEHSAASGGQAREYYTASNTWTSTAGDTNATVAYTAADGRPYAYAESYKGGPIAQSPVKAEPTSSTAPNGAYPNNRPFVEGLNNYSWSTS